MLKLYVRRLHIDAKLPSYSTPNAAGLDLYAVESTVIEPKERATIPLGIAIAIPEGYYGRIAGRSGLASKLGIDVLGGVVDCDYRGEVKAVLYNTDKYPFQIVAGNRVAQMVIEKVATVMPEWAEELSDTARGTDGWGSSGK